MKYRPEIDGLRALAILPVILFHLHSQWMPGGYLGVDLFFVISGYLITGILFREIETGSFSIAGFYERRIRRIVPALLAMVLVVLLISPMFLFSWEVRDVAWSGLATLAFSANFYFYHSVNYFQENSAWYPLLHMWSLGVEEQYYIVFPLLLYAIARAGCRKRGLIGILTLISALSFLWALHASVVNAEAGFYLFPYRAWELGIGGIAAVLVAHGHRLKGWPAQVLTGLATLFILASLVLVSPGHLSPIYKLPLVVATAVILAADMPRSPLWSLLSWTPIRWIGAISFSLYLWHQPVFAFAKADMGTITLPTAGLLLFLVFALASASYYLVETPFRRSALPRPRVLRLGLSALLAGALINILAAQVATPSLLTALGDKSLDVSTSSRGAYVYAAYNRHSGTAFTDPNAFHLLLIGDSYSQDLYNMISRNHAFPKAEIVTHFVKADCQPYFGKDDVSKFIRPSQRWVCLHDPRRKRTDVPKALIAKADLVLVAANWRDWSADRIAAIYRHFQDRTKGKVIIIGHKYFGPGGPIDLHLFRGMSQEEKAAFRFHIGGIFPESYSHLLSHIGAIPMVDVEAKVCDMKAGTCPVFDPKGDLITFDGSHLTRDGALWVGHKVLSDPLLTPFEKRAGAK